MFVIYISLVRYSQSTNTTMQIVTLQHHTWVQLHAKEPISDEVKLLQNNSDHPMPLLNILSSQEFIPLPVITQAASPNTKRLT